MEITTALELGALTIAILTGVAALLRMSIKKILAAREEDEKIDYAYTLSNNNAAVMANGFSELRKGILELSKALEEHMREEERQARLQTSLVKQLTAAVETRTSAMFQQAVFASDVAYYELSRDTAEDPWRLEWVNQAYLDLTGMTLERAAGGGFWEVVDPDDRARVVPISERHLADPTSTLDITMTLVNQDTGVRTPVRVISSPIPSAGGGPALSYVGAVVQKHAPMLAF